LPSSGNYKKESKRCTKKSKNFNYSGMEEMVEAYFLFSINIALSLCSNFKMVQPAYYYQNDD
jgi:hypothetical protein